MVALLLLALAVGQACFGGRPSWALYILFLALVPVVAVAFARRPPELFGTRRGLGLSVALGLGLALVWLLPTLRARGWTLVAIGAAGLAATLAAAAHRRDLRRLALALVGFGALQAFLGVLQAATGFDVLGEFREPGRLATGTFTNRNHLAGFLNLALAFALGQVYVGATGHGWRRPSERWGWTWLFLLVGGLIGLGVLLSRSRAGVVTLVLTIVFLGCLMIARRGGRRRGPSVAAAWVLLSLVVLLGLAVGVDSLLGRFTEITSDARPEIFAGTLELIGDHWFVGVGAGMYRWAFRPYQTADLGYWYTHAHNDYLEIAADFGLPLAALFWGFAFWRLYRAGRLAIVAPRSAERGLALGAAGGIFSLAVHGLVDFNLHIPANLLAFAIVLGLAWSLEPAAPQRLPKLAMTGLAAALFVVLLGATWLSARRLSAEASILRADSLEDLERGVAWAPDSPESQQALGRFLRDAPVGGDPVRAASHLERAASLNPLDWQLHWELAQLHELAGRYEKAAVAFEQAILRNPRDGRYRWRRANFLLRRGEIETALPEIRAAVEARSDLARPAWNLLARLELSPAEIDRAWPTEPLSRLRLLRFATGSPDVVDPSFLTAQWRAVLASQSPPTPAQGAFFVGWKVRRGEELEAHREWVELLGANGYQEHLYTRGAEAVWNGGFELAPSSSPFDWRLSRGDGFALAILSTAAPDGSAALRLRFDGTKNVEQVLASQLAAVEPARSYYFSWSSRTSGVTTDQRPVLEIVARPQGTVLFSHEMEARTAPWQNHRRLVKTTPETQVIEVRLRRRRSLRLDSKADGAIWLDAISLARSGDS